MSETALFHVVAVNNQTGKRTRLTVTPMTERECKINASKFSVRRERRIEVVPAIEAPSLTPDNPPHGAGQ